MNTRTTLKAAFSLLVASSLGLTGAAAASAQSTHDQTTTQAAQATDLNASFAGLEDFINGEIGVAIAPVDPMAGDVQTFGQLQSGAAWSTAKVPIAVAALRAGTANPADVNAAITVSDNNAAANLWNSMGGGAEAARMTDAIVSEAGDLNTTFANNTNGFGLTEWGLADQAKFAAGLDRLKDPAAEQVKNEMFNIAPHQQWGMGTMDWVAFKGGWGPGNDGMYLDRQMGIVKLDGRLYGVAIAARNYDGTHESSTINLTMLAQWIQDNATNFS